MALNDGSSLSLLLDDLKELAEKFIPTYNAGVSQCIETLRFKITTLVNHPDSLRDSSAPKGNGNVEFTMVKQKLLGNMKNLYEEVENEWIAQLANQRTECTRKIEEFLNKTELKMEVKLPVLPCNVANYNSLNSAQPDGPSNSQCRVNQAFTQTSDLMSNSIQDTSVLLSHIKTEDDQPQTSTCSLLNYPDQQVPSTTASLMLDDTRDASVLVCHSEEALNIQFQASRIEPLNYSEQNADCTQFMKAISKSPVKPPGNQLVLHSNTNGSTSQSLTPHETNQCSTSASNIYPVNYSTPNTPNTAALIPGISSFKNATGKDFNSENRLLTYPAPEIVSPQKKHPCLYCDKTYNHESQLKLHMPKHTGERDYECRLCGKRFKGPGTRDGHEKDHCKKRIKLSTEENLPQIPEFPRF